jgi:hypothetical protein
MACIGMYWYVRMYVCTYGGMDVCIMHMPCSWFHPYVWTLVIYPKPDERQTNWCLTRKQQSIGVPRHPCTQQEPMILRCTWTSHGCYLLVWIRNPRGMHVIQNSHIVSRSEGNPTFQPVQRPIDKIHGWNSSTNSPVRMGWSSGLGWAAPLSVHLVKGSWQRSVTQLKANASVICQAKVSRTHTHAYGYTYTHPYQYIYIYKYDHGIHGWYTHKEIINMYIYI